MKYKYILNYMVCIIFLYGCSLKEKEVVFNGLTMGTSYQIKINHLDENQKKNIDDLKKNIHTIVTQLDNSMSTYKKSSEISRFNNYDSGYYFLFSKHVMNVVKEALYISKISDGAFDITVNPLVDLWGFGGKSKKEARYIPGPNQINEILKKKISYKNLKMRGFMLLKSHPDLSIDLSALAKGYAVDSVANYLERNNIHNYLVEIGGELKVKGKNSKNQSWKIAIEQPKHYDRFVQEIIQLNNNSIATSGDYRNFFEQDGYRYSHTINPKNGAPINHSLVSVSVIHESCMTADALATTLNVLGLKKGLEFAKKYNISAYFVEKSNSTKADKKNQFQVTYTDSFKKFLLK